MKKVATAIVIVFFQLLVGTLVLVGLLSSRTDIKKVAVVENNNLSKMAETVNIMFVEELVKHNLMSKPDEELEDEEKLSKEENKEEYLAEYKTDEVKEEVVISEDNEEDHLEEAQTSEVLDTYVGSLTGYGPDCNGCSGNTASGYYIGNTITYNDSAYGTVRIVAADKSIPFYSIVRISNVPGMDTITAIVLDTGGSVGFGKATLFDLLFDSESNAISKTNNVTFEILRWGGA